MSPGFISWASSSGHLTPGYLTPSSDKSFSFFGDIESFDVSNHMSLSCVNTVSIYTIGASTTYLIQCQVYYFASVVKMKMMMMI